LAVECAHLPRSGFRTVADQLTDVCRTSTDGAHEAAIVVCRADLSYVKAPLRGAAASGACGRRQGAVLGPAGGRAPGPLTHEAVLSFRGAKCRRPLTLPPGSRVDATFSEGTLMLRRLATAAACALALILACPALAQADTRGFLDRRGDVWRMSNEAGKHTRVPDRRQGDIRRTFFTHTDNQFIIRSKFAQLNRTGNLILLEARLKTNTGVVRRVVLTASPRQGTNQWRGITEVTRRNGITKVDCETRHRINYTRNVAIVRVPRTCLDNPRSVRATQGVATFQGAAVFTDNPKNGRATVHLPPFTAPIRH
jgi:hypothetical protein